MSTFNIRMCQLSGPITKYLRELTDKESRLFWLRVGKHPVHSGSIALEPVGRYQPRELVNTEANPFGSEKGERGDQDPQSPSRAHSQWPRISLLWFVWTPNSSRLLANIPGPSNGPGLLDWQTDPLSSGSSLALCSSHLLLISMTAAYSSSSICLFFLYCFSLLISIEFECYSWVTPQRGRVPKNSVSPTSIFCMSFVTLRDYYVHRKSYKKPCNKTHVTFVLLRYIKVV